MACALTIEVVTDPSIERLARRAGMALDKAGLDDAMDRVHNLLTHGPHGKFFEARVVNGRMFVEWRPFAELAMHDAIGIATDKSLDDATKARRMDEMFTLAGME